MIRDSFEFAAGRLRPLQPTDADPILRACQDPQIIRWTQIPQPYRLADAQQFIDTRAGEDRVWVMDVDGLAGVIGLRATVDAFPGASAAVGYWVAPWARGRGIATAALRAVRDELAGAGYQRIDWATIAGNEASLRVARKAGFQIEGYRRQAIVQRGRLVDAVVGCWTATTEVPELVAGVWQLQPAAMDEVPPDLRPLASCAIGVWMTRSAVGGIDSGLVLAVRSKAGVHVYAPDAPQPAAAAARRYLDAQGHVLTDQPLPTGWH